MKQVTSILPTFLCVFLVLATATGVNGAEKPLTEKEKIERLFEHLEKMKDAKFVRNDVEYDGKTAALFLRSRWEKREKEVKSAAEFIEKFGSVSSTTSKPYLIRFKDGKETKSGEYLAIELKKLESKPEEKK